jgi:hypothetical protein
LSEIPALDDNHASVAAVELAHHVDRKCKFIDYSFADNHDLAGSLFYQLAWTPLLQDVCIEPFTTSTTCVSQQLLKCWFGLAINLGHQQCMQTGSTLARDARSQIEGSPPVGSVVKQRKDSLYSPRLSARNYANMYWHSAGALEHSSHRAAHSVGAERGFMESNQYPSCVYIERGLDNIGSRIIGPLRDGLDGQA